MGAIWQEGYRDEAEPRTTVEELPLWVGSGRSCQSLPGGSVRDPDTCPAENADFRFGSSTDLPPRSLATWRSVAKIVSGDVDRSAPSALASDRQAAAQLALFGPAPGWGDQDRRSAAQGFSPRFSSPARRWEKRRICRVVALKTPRTHAAADRACQACLPRAGQL
jgi:hypothetical protein